MKTSFEKKTANLFSILGNPFRIKLLLTIGDGEACVCHLEALLDQRQAYISQHLMALRKAELLKTRKDGKFVFYQLSDPALLDLVAQAGKLAGIDPPAPKIIGDQGKTCCCPHSAEAE